MSPPMPPPGKPPALDPREQILLKMQRALCDFYRHFNPSKLTKSTVSILMQYWWDYGLGPLNKKLKTKYGQGMRLSQDPLQNWYEGSFSITIVPRKEVRLESFQQFLIIKGIPRQNTSEFFTGPEGRPLKKMPWKSKRISRADNKPPPQIQMRGTQKPKKLMGPPAGVNHDSWYPPESPGPSFRQDKTFQAYRPKPKHKRSGGKKSRRHGKPKKRPSEHSRANRLQKGKTPAPVPNFNY